MVISDIGFGLERIGQAINKLALINDFIRPLNLSIPTAAVDSVRTLILLNHAKVKTGHRGSGLSKRRLLKKIENYLEIEFYIESLFAFYCR